MVSHIKEETPLQGRLPAHTSLCFRADFTLGLSIQAGLSTEQILARLNVFVNQL